MGIRPSDCGARQRVRSIVQVEGARAARADTASVLRPETGLGVRMRQL